MKTFMLKHTWYLIRFLELTENTTPERAVAFSSYSITHGLVTMHTKAMPTGRSFRNKPQSSMQQQQVLVLPPVSEHSLAPLKRETNIFSRLSWHFFRNRSALKTIALPFFEESTQFGTGPRTQCDPYPTCLSSFPSWPTVSQLGTAEQSACKLIQVTTQ